MNPTTIEFKNYKLLQDEKFDFPQEGNVYFVMGSNNKGKTSFILGFLSLLEAKNLTPNPVSQGQDEGSLTLDIEDKNGNPFSVKFEFTDNKAKFTLLTPEGITTQKVGEIRNFFDYEGISAEEFVKLGNNAKDKKRQRDIFLKMMDPADIKTFNDLEEKLNSSFTKRTEVKRSKDALEATLSTSVSKEDQQLLDQKESLFQEKTNLKIKKEKAEEMDRLKERHETGVIRAKEDALRYQEKIDVLTKELKAYEEDLARAQVSIKECQDAIDVIPVIEFDKNRLEEIEVLSDRINEIAGKAMAIKDNKSKLETVDQTWKTLDKEVEEYREKVQTLLQEKGPDVDKIIIRSDGLYYQDGELVVPFTEEQVGTAEVYKITAKILMQLNKKTPIILMGRAESLDLKSIGEIAKMAEEMGAKIIFDRVLPNESNIQLIGIENLNETLKENLK